MPDAQLAMPVCDWPNNPRLSPVAVRVNEVNVYLYGERDVASWWHECFRLWPGQEARVCVEATTIVGEQVHVHCENREHADQLAAHLLVRGLNKAAVKVIRTNCGDLR